MIPRNQIKENDTMHCTKRETQSCHFPRNAFSKVWKQKKRPVNSQWAKKTKQSLCPSHRAHYLDPRGKRRCSSTKALALDKHKLNSKRKKKERKENAIKPKTQNTTTHNTPKTQQQKFVIWMKDLSQQVLYFFNFCFLKDYSSLSRSALFCIGPRRKLSAAHN